MLNWYFSSNLLFHTYFILCVPCGGVACSLISLFCLNCCFICTIISLCMFESAVRLWLIHRFPCMVNIHCTVNNICYFKKENDCEKWILIHVGDMTALFFLLLLQMLVYRYIDIYIYSYCNVFTYICMNIYDECWWNKSVLYMKSKNMYFIYTIYQKFWYTMFIT